MTKTHVILLALAVIAVVTVLVARPLAYHVLPVGWTGEPARLAALLRLQPGGRAAEIGGGDGALAVQMAAIVGEAGHLFVTELDAEKKTRIERRIRAASLPHTTVLTAEADRTSLPEACCDAIYMRMVFHHIGDRHAFARDVSRALRPGGRVAVIDFAPGALFFLGPNHGVRADAVLEAFASAGLQLVHRDDAWGGGNFALVFEAQRPPNHD